MKRPQRDKVLKWTPPSDLTSQVVERIMALPGSVKADYLKGELLSKFVSSETDPAELRQERAISKWLSVEEKNEVTEERLQLTHEEYNILPRVSYGQFLDWCRNYICDIIGETPPVEALLGTFSGGASTSRSRTRSHPASKYVGTAHATRRALEVFVDLVVDECPGWLNAQTSLACETVNGNVMFTVPKKADIDRVAAKEPDLNMFIQKGIGDYLRGSLRRIGINLNDQSRNRSLAREGSITGKLATLDLSSASDSVTSELVFQLLPVTWFTLLDSVRSPVTILPDGVEHRNCMFSSMGNGFTFELESLLFFVLCKAVCYFTGTRGVVSVYGDDIICPTEASDDVIWVLGFFGFQVNPDKSFQSGPFRESCGGHFHDGHDITPFYLKAPIQTLPDLIDVANKLRRWGEMWNIIDPEVEDIWLWLKSLIPSCLWGGDDTSFKFQLASFDVPCYRLSNETVSRSTGVGGYYHWLNTTWDRTDLKEAVETSTASRNLNRYRLRPARLSAVTQLSALFHHEIVRGTRACPS